MVSLTNLANRVMQRVGARLLDTTGGDFAVLTDTTNNAAQFNAAYDFVRRAEMRRNIWRFTVRRTALRAVDTTTMLLSAPTYNPATTYGVNILVSYNNVLYTSTTSGNIGNQPNISPTKWTAFFGPLTVSEFDSTAIPQTSYYAGEFVYDPNNANAVYMSSLNGNQNALTDPTWVAQAGATVSAPNIIYPLGAGPSQDIASRNIFVLPNGFLREAPQDPTAGNVSYLGYPGNLMQTDWTFENNYITTREAEVIAFRFAADIPDLNMWDPMFAEGLASRLSLELAEPLTQSTAKLQAIGQEYKQFMGDARMTNGIETGATAPPLDDFIAARI